MKRAYGLIVFDWDGTLMDSAPKIVRCFQKALAESGVRDPGEAAIRHIIGLGLNEAVDALLPQEPPETRARVVHHYREQFLHHDPTPSDLFPGVQEGLEALARRGYLLAVATGKSRRGLARVLEQTALGELFVATRCADEARSKPHPQMLEDVLEQAGIEPDRAIMIGDTVYDMEMARNARVDGLAVTYGVHAREMLMPFAPVACLDSFREVHQWMP